MINNEDEEESKDLFYLQLNADYNWRGKSNFHEGKKISRFMITEEKQKKYIKMLKTTGTDNEDKKTPEYYYIVNTFDVCCIEGKERLVKKNKNNKYLISVEEMWEIINNCHVNCGHGGEKRTMYYIKKNMGIVNISLQHVKLFISMCKSCLKKKILKKSKYLNPIISNGFLERVQVDLIDMKSALTVSENRFNYVFVFQDHLTKYVILKPLVNKQVSSIITVLIDIFTTIGCPKILQSDNGNEFNFEDEIGKIWPDIKIIKGRPRHPQSQGSIERANQDIQQMLRCYIDQHKYIDWSTALPFIQLQKNTALNRTIATSPYYAVFGQNIKCPVNRNQYQNIREEEEEIILDEIYNICDKEKEEITLILNKNDENTIDDIIEIEIMEYDEFHNEEEMGHKVLPQKNEEEDFNIYMKIQENSARIMNFRDNVVSKMKKAAEKMTSSSNTKHLDSFSCKYDIGTIVTIQIPKVDRIHKLGFNNMLGRVVKYFPSINKYKIESLESKIIIKHLFSPNDLTKVNLEKNNDNLPQCSSSSSLQHQLSNNEKPLRSVIINESHNLSVYCSCLSTCNSLKCPCKKVNRNCRVGICHVKNTKTNNMKILCKNNYDKKNDTSRRYKTRKSVK